MEFLGFETSKAGLDVWMRKLAKKDTVTVCDEYVLLYTDDCLVMSDRTESVLRHEIGKYFKLKDSSIGSPSKCFGGKLQEVMFQDDQKCCAVGSKQYVEGGAKNVVDYLKKREHCQMDTVLRLTLQWSPDKMRQHTFIL